MKQRITLDTMENVKSIGFGFENCEYYEVPIECFKCFDLSVDEEGYSELSCHIVDNGWIIEDWNEACFTFAQRINKCNDITDVRIKYNNNSKYDYRVHWYYNEDDMWSTMENNEYQKSTFHSYKEVEFTITKSNKTYTTKEVLHLGMKQEVVVEDEFEIEYIASNGSLFLKDSDEPMPLSLEILNARFTLVD